MWEPSVDTINEYGEGSTRRLEVHGGYLYQTKIVIKVYDHYTNSPTSGDILSTNVFWSAPVFVPGYDE